jgi:glycerophosphoryl diester phosphodiesterase
VATRVPHWLLGPIAHRGLHDRNVTIAENSLTAFAAAAEAGLPIELDVRPSADGEAVVHHDATLQRLCGVEASVGHLTAAELAQHPLAGTADSTPVLAEVLDLVAGRVGVAVELKPARRTALLCRRVVDVLTAYEGAATVHSFDPRIVAWFARTAPEVVRGQAIGAEELPPPLRRALDGLWARGTPPDYLVCSLEQLTHPRVAALRAGGLPVLGYTVRTGADQRRAAVHADGCFVESWDRTDPVVGLPLPPSLR